jgi:hypothetical protein
MEAEAFTASPTGQRLKSDLDDLHQRVRTGEAEAKAREEVLKALRMVNDELKRVATHWGSSPEGDKPEQAPPGEGQPPVV